VLWGVVPDHASELGAGTIRCRRGEVPPGLWLHDAKSVRGAAPLVLVVLVWLASPAWLGSASAHRRAARLVFRPYKPQVRLHRRAFHRRPARPPSFGCTVGPVRPRTTFFSRHGFRSWLCCKTRIVSRLALGTSLRLTASSTIRRTVQRARPSGGFQQTMATIRCFWESSRTGLRPRTLSIVERGFQAITVVAVGYLADGLRG